MHLICGVAEWGWKVVVLSEDDWELSIRMCFAVLVVLDIIDLCLRTCRFFCQFMLFFYLPYLYILLFCGCDHGSLLITVFELYTYIACILGRFEGRFCIRGQLFCMTLLLVYRSLHSSISSIHNSFFYSLEYCYFT